MILAGEYEVLSLGRGKRIINYLEIRKYYFVLGKRKASERNSK